MSKASKKKQDPNHRVGSGSKNDKELSNSATSSGVNAAAIGEVRARSKTYPLWPEFSEADINVEKWEVARSVKERGKSPSLGSAQQFFDDTEGKIEMPSNMQVQQWARLPQELSASKSFVVVENEEDFDLINYSKHLCCYPLMRMIMSQITLLWNLECARKIKPHKERPRMASSPELSDDGRWKPWEHIYSMCKSGRGHMPLYNPTGKYVIRLYYMGCWRKIVVDDQMPYNADSQLMLPTSAHKNELWPMLLSKALVKIASVNYRQSNNGNDLRLAEFSVIHSLTGWLPEITPLCPINDTWELMTKLLPSWKYPTDAKEEECVAEAEESNPAPVSPTVAPVVQAVKGDVKGQGSLKKLKEVVVDTSSSPIKHMKDGKKRGSDVLRERQKSDSDSTEFLYTTPETVVFATFDQPVPTPAPLSVIKNMADGSEVLRNIGLSQIMHHPVLIRKTRSLPLMPAEVKAPVPRWQLIRPRPKPSDSSEKEPKKPDMWLEVSSPFLHMPKAKPDRKSGIFSSSLHELDEYEEEQELAAQEEEERSHEEKSYTASAPCVKPSTGVNDVKKLSKAGLASTASMRNSKDSSSHEKSKESDQTQVTTNLHLNNEYMMPTDADFIKSVWIDFDDFCKTFKNIIVFHKPNTYRYNSNSSDYKTPVLSGLGPSSGLAPPQNTGTSSKKNSIQPSSTNLHSKNASPSSVFTTCEPTQDKPIEETQVHSFLMVDSVEPSEVIICLSSLVYWPGIDIKQLSRDSLTGETGLETSKKSFASSGKTSDESSKGDIQPPTLFRGHVVVEPYSWVDCKVHQPILDIRTNGVYATCLLLPPGRHVLRLNISWNYGHHVQVCSTTSFTYGDEDTVLALLKEESARFKVVAGNIATSLDQLIAAMGSPEKWKKAEAALRKYYDINYEKAPDDLAVHTEAFFSGLFSLMERILPDLKGYEVKRLLQTLTLYFDELSYRPRKTMFSCSGELPAAMVGCSKECRPVKDTAGYDRTHYLANLKLQKHYRGYIVRKTMYDHRRSSVRDAGPMATFRSALRSNPGQHGSYMLRQMLKYEPMLASKYSFCDDESKKVCFTEFSEAFNEQPAHSWFVVARCVFSADEDSYCVPKLYGIPSNRCLLHVVDNDIGREVRRVFNRPVPHLYTKNKNGYTLAAEMKTTDCPLPAGRWKIKFLGSEVPQLAPTNGVIESNFQTKELRGFYIPSSSQVIFRYVVQCKVSQLTSLQIETSDKQVQFQLQIFNKGKAVATKRAKGHLFVPYCYFVGKTTPKVEVESTPAGQSFDKSGKSKGAKGTKSSARAHSPKEESKKKERKPTMEDDDDLENRLYYLQLTVLNHSWRLTEQQLAYVEKIKELEREEMKLDFGGGSDSKEDMEHSASDKSNERKFGKDSRKNKVPRKGGKESSEGVSNKVSSHSEVNFDTSKAYWTMRVVCDADRADDIDIRKDRSRLKEIKAMKQAWEAMEEGRASRAKESRQKYLDSLQSPDSDEEEQPDKRAVRQSALPPLPLHTGDDVPIEPTLVGVVCPFTKVEKRRGSMFFDVKALTNIESARRAKLDEQEAQRQKMCEEELDANCRQRVLLKEQLMEECFELQLQTDLYRTRLFKPRNDYRQGLLDDLRFEQEKAAVAAAALETLSGANNGKGAAKKKK